MCWKRTSRLDFPRWMVNQLAARDGCEAPKNACFWGVPHPIPPGPYVQPYISGIALATLPLKNKVWLLNHHAAVNVAHARPYKGRNQKSIHDSRFCVILFSRKPVFFLSKRTNDLFAGNGSRVLLVNVAHARPSYGRNQKSIHDSSFHVTHSDIEVEFSLVFQKKNPILRGFKSFLTELKTEIYVDRYAR